MAGKRYSAGAIFLQVVPVFADVQRNIERQVEDIDRALGDDMEKAGRKAGERAGKAMAESMDKEGKKGAEKYAGHFESQIKSAVKAAEREIGRLDLSTATEQMLKDLDKAKAKLRELRDQDFSVDFNAKQVLGDVAAVKAAVEGLTKGDHEINVQSNIKKAIRDIEAGLAFVDKELARDRVVEVEVEVDTKVAERKMGAFEKAFKRSMDRAAGHLGDAVHKESAKLRDELRYLENLRIGLDVSGVNARKEMREVMADLRRIMETHDDIDVVVNAGKAYAELAALDKAVDHLDGRRIELKADLDSAAARAGMFRLARSGDDASNSFRSFNAILLVAAGLGPALVPVLGAIAGGLLAIGPAAAVAVFGLSSVAIGFSGIADAVGALQARDEAAAATADQSAKAQVDGARAVAAARRAAADAVEAALDRQKDAQEAYAESIQDVKDAEQALAEARAAARGTGADIDERISDNALAQDQGLLDVFNATVAYNSVMADGSATNAEQEQARIQLEQARDALDDLRKEAKELAKEKRKWDKEGVNGTEEVEQAQENLNDAIEAQKDAYEDLRDAAEAVDEARADGARAVADAMRQQADAMEQVSTQQQKVATEFDKLGPAGQAFALFIHGLRDEFYAFRDDLQKVLLPQVQEAIESFFGSKAGATLRKAMIALADSFGRIVVALSQSFQGPAWMGFFQMLADLGPDIQDAYGRAFIAFLEGMASILTILAPFALEFAEAFARVMESFAGWAASKEATQQFNEFLDYVRQVAPDVIDFFGAFVKFVVAVAKGLAQWGEVVLGGITGFLNAMANMDPMVLSAIVVTLLVLITASQTAYAIMNLLMAGAALFSSTVGIWVFAIVGVALALAYLYKTNENFRDFVQDAWGKISAALKDAWENYIKPALTEFYGAVERLWKKVLLPFLKWLGPILVWVATKIIPLLAIAWVVNIKIMTTAINLLVDVILVIADVVVWLWEKVIEPVWKAIAAASLWLWENVLRPVFKAFAALIVGVGKALSWVWRNILWPVFKAIGKVVWNLWKFQIKVALVLIKAFFKATFIALKWIWEHILRPVFNAIATAAKWLYREGIKPALDWISDRWDEVMRGMKWVWNNVLKPVFDWIGDKALPKLKGAFETTIDAISEIWDGLKKVVGTPIKFVIEKVINEGLIDSFNKVADWVNMDGFDHISVPKWMQSYATGGIMPGYTPGRDPHKFYSPTGGRLELSGGEAVMRPEWTRAMGPQYVNQMNAIARSKGVSGIRQAMGGAYSLGGVLPGGSISPHSSYGFYAADMNYPGYADYDKPIHAYAKGYARSFDYGADSSYGRGVVIDHGNAMTLYAHMSRIAASAIGKIVNEGTTIGYVGDYGNTGSPPTSHLHFEIRPGGSWPGVPYTSSPGSSDGNYAASGGDGGGRSVPGFIKDVLLHPIDTIKGWISKPWQSASAFITDSPVWDFVKNVPMQAVEGIKDKAWDILPGWAKKAVGLGGKALDVAGDVGGAVADGIGAGLDTIGLATGGILPYNGTMMYDNGGYLPPGLTTVMNLTGKPEPVFTNDQWSNLEGGGVGGGNIHYEPHFEGSDLTAADVAGDLNFTFRQIKRRGKYAGVGS